MNKLAANTIVFVLSYVLFMIPTYLLPDLGSNSSVLNTTSMGLMPAFWLRLLCLFALVSVVWVRGNAINASWLLVFPVLALVFDFAPGLNIIPFVPTVMHLLAIIFGIVKAQKPEKRPIL